MQNPPIKQSTFFPFGPGVYLNAIEPKILNELKDAIDKSIDKEEYSARHLLAGRIGQQFEIEQFCSPAVTGHILQHCQQYLFDLGGQSFDESMTIDSLWVNVQRELEINPLHMHTGFMSFVIYIENQLDYEKTINNKYDNVRNEEPMAGHIMLKYGESNSLNFTNWSMFPQEGQILIFPSWLTHQVYPHYEEGKVRISVAGNLS